MTHLFAINKETPIKNLHDLANNLHNLGFNVKPGLSDARLKDIEEAFGATLPVDLREFLSICVPLSFRDKDSVFVDWHTVDLYRLSQSTKATILGSLVFDIKEAGYWHVSFGNKPDDIASAIEKAQAIVRLWPPLIPVFGHRMMPSMYSGEHAPVLSVVQFTDSIVYGNNLYDYFSQEFGLKLSGAKPTTYDISKVPFWGPAFADDM